MEVGTKWVNRSEKYCVDWMHTGLEVELELFTLAQADAACTINTTGYTVLA